MKNLFLILFTTFYISATYAQIGISDNNSAPHSSAQLDVKSTTKAFYPPRMTTAQKNAIVSPQAGAVVFDNTLNQLSFYNGSAWVAAGGGGAATLTLPYQQSASDPTGTNGIFRLNETGATNLGIGIYGVSTNGTGILGFSSNHKGLEGFSSNGIGGYFSSISGKSIITGTGKVGIGVPNPLTILDVKSRMRVGHDTETSGIYFDNSSHIIKSFIGMRNDNHIGLYGFNGAEWAFNMNLTNGNIGIGNDAPLDKLHITGGYIRLDAFAGLGYRQVYSNPLGQLEQLGTVAFSAKSINSVPLPQIPTSGSFTIPFNTADYNFGNFFNTTTYEFTAPVNGIYHFDTFVTFGAITSANSSSEYILSMEVDNVLETFIQDPMVNTTEWKSMNLSQDLKLNTGQKVKVTLNQTSGATVSLIGGQYNAKFTGHLVMRL